MTYDEMKRELMDSNPGMQTVLASALAEANANLPTFTLDELRVANPDELPDVVDPCRKEVSHSIIAKILYLFS